MVVCMGKFLGFAARSVVEKDGQFEGSGGLYRSRKKDEEKCPFEVDEKEIFSTRSNQAKVKAGEKID